MTDLATSIAGLLDAIADALEAATDLDLPLEGIKKIVRGDRARPLPEMPAIWVVPDLAQFRQASYGVETWALPISLAVLVKGDDPRAAARISQTYAAKARSIALAARPADDSNIALTDIVSQSFDPSAHSSERNRALFWTEATILATFDCDS